MSRSQAVAAPPADAARVAAIRNSLDLKDKGSIDSFGERARREVVASAERLVSEVRTRDLIEAGEIIRHAIETVGELEPARLTPTGMAAMFGGRRQRLGWFRGRFETVGHVIDDLASDLKERADRIERKTQALNHLHEQARTFILELDAYIEAGRGRRAEMGQGASEKQLEGAERLGHRVEDLSAGRAAAIEELPLVRIVQNIDAPLGETMNGALDALSRWRSDWSDRLGLKLEKRARVRPDEHGMAHAKAELIEALKAADRTLAEARARRSETEELMDAAARRVRAAGKA
jgi:uncharacterized protein YaaN involved in tellurite resistance